MKLSPFDYYLLVALIVSVIAGSIGAVAVAVILRSRGIGG